jgi:hypothetical protein
MSTRASKKSSSMYYCSASDNRVTSYYCDGAATINSASIIAAASTILVARIAVAAIVATAYNCPRRKTALRPNGPDLRKLVVIHESWEDAFGRSFRALRVH